MPNYLVRVSRPQVVTDEYLVEGATSEEDADELVVAYRNDLISPVNVTYLRTEKEFTGDANWDIQEVEV